MATAKIENGGSSGALTVVAAVPGQRIVVTSYTIVVSDAVNLTWKSNATAISGVMGFSAGGQGCAPPPLPQEETWNGIRGLIETVAGQALVLTVGSSVQVGGHLTYELR